MRLQQTTREKVFVVISNMPSGDAEKHDKQEELNERIELFIKDLKQG